MRVLVSLFNAMMIRKIMDRNLPHNSNLCVVSDTHIGAPHDIKIPYEEIQAMKQVLSYPMVLTGDIFDLANCKKEDVEKYRELAKSFKQQFGADYVYGNHELDLNVDQVYCSIKEINGKRVLFLHGHTLCWPNEKVVAWESEVSSGRGVFSRALYSFYRHTIKKHYGGFKKPSDEVIYKAVNLAKAKNCVVIIYGHTHNNYDGIHDGIRIINVNRGITYLEI